MKELTKAAQAAKMIRQELKKAFPTTKFTVKSKNFSMGDSIDISWQNGPCIKQVRSITGKYQYGYFDGMTDSYDYTNDRKDIPQSKYVHESREITDDILLPIFETYKTKLSGWDNLKGIDDTDKELFISWRYWTPRNYILSKLSETDLSNGYHED